MWFLTIFQAFKASKNAQISAGIALVIVVGLGLYIWIVTNRQSDLQDAADQARNQVQAEVLEKTVEQVKEANDAREQVRNDVDNARYTQCLRSARTPANCQRYLLPQQSPDNGGASPN